MIKNPTDFDVSLVERCTDVWSPTVRLVKTSPLGEQSMKSTICAFVAKNHPAIRTELCFNNHLVLPLSSSSQGGNL